jgi:hypothetical protein
MRRLLCRASQSQAQQPQQQQQQQQAAQAHSPFLQHPYYTRERFNDLPDEVKNMVEELE